MKIANHDGRLVLITDDGAIDVQDASDGTFDSDPASIYDRWEEFASWAATSEGESKPLSDATVIGAPSPRPRQVFAIGLNYANHAAETGREVPKVPAVFTKYPASLTGPFSPIQLQGDRVDWEVELVVVMGKRADRVSAADGWSHVAGLCVGQDISDRTVQQAAGAQFSLAKSFRSYGPTGPMMVSPDEFADPNDLGLSCVVDGETVQQDRTSSLAFSVPQLISEISAIVPMLPGDLIFTGTPAGVGVGRTPPRFLQVGNVVESWVEGIGTIRNEVIEPQ